MHYSLDSSYITLALGITNLAVLSNFRCLYLGYHTLNPSLEELSLPLLELFQFSGYQQNWKLLEKSFSAPKLTTLIIYAMRSTAKFTTSMKNLLIKVGSTLTTLEVLELSTHQLPREIWTYCSQLKVLGVGTTSASVIYFTGDSLWAPWRAVKVPPQGHPLCEIHISGHPMGIHNTEPRLEPKTCYFPRWKTVSQILLKWSWNERESEDIIRHLKQAFDEAMKHGCHFVLVDRSKKTYDEWRYDMSSV